MSDAKTEPKQPAAQTWKRSGINLVAFLIPLIFVWLVFDNLALGLLVALLFGGGAEASQRAVRSKDNSED